MGQWGKQTALKRKNTKGRLIYILNVQHPDPSVKYRLKSLWDFISLQTEWPRSRNKSRLMLARLGGKRDFFSVQTEGGRTCEATIAINMELHAKIKNRITIWPSYPILEYWFLTCLFFLWHWLWGPLEDVISLDSSACTQNVDRKPL